MQSSTPAANTLPATRSAGGPAGNFLLGSTLDFMRDPLDFLQRTADQHGAVARYRIANLTIFQVNHPDGVQRILQENNHNYLKGDYWDIIRQVGGDGLFTSEGAFWLRQRRLMQPAFHRQRIAGFASLITRLTEEMLARWQTYTRSQQPLDVSQEFTDLTMKVITEAMFSTRMDEDTRAISQAITLLLEDMNFRFELPLYPKLYVPTPRNLRARRALQVVDRVVYRIIQERRTSSKPKNDLLGMLMEARDEDTGEAMTDRQLRDEVITIFVAGHETTAVLLTWLFHALSSRPEIEQRLHAEASQALGGRLPEFADLTSFPYLRLTIDETLRYFPPVWVTNREVIQDDVLCGCRIPSGSIVLVAPYVIHRLPAYWENPERFDPERFTPERSAGRPRFAYLPFGGGPHQCIGNNFALAEAQLIFTTLIQRYRLAAAPDHKVEMQPTVTLRPKAGLWMLVVER